MLFTVSQISPQVELVFANSDKFINVYPTYHQMGSLNYRNVDASAWTLVGTKYRWETTLPIINNDTVPMIQLVYSYGTSEEQRQQQYDTFKTITSVETVEGSLYFYTPIQPTIDFRIRYRVLNRMDLAIPLNRGYAVGVGFTPGYSELMQVMSCLNPVSNEMNTYAASVPLASNTQCGMMPSGIIARLEKMEKFYNEEYLPAPYRIRGYPSSAAMIPTTEDFNDITEVQSVPANSWYKECAIYSRTDATDFTTANHLFYQQQATVLDLTHVYTGNVTTFSYALAANNVLTEIIGLNLLDTHNAIDISYMFAENQALTRLDLSELYLDDVENIEGLFKSCTALEYLDVRSIDFAYTPPNSVPIVNQPDVFTGVPDDAVILVSGENQYQAIHAKYPNLTNITYN